MESLNFTEKVDKIKYTYEEFKLIIDNFKESVDIIEDEYHKANDVTKFYEMQSILKKHYEDFIGQLLAEKEKFSKIFETDSGSIYFVLSDDRSIRFKFNKYKNMDNKNPWEHNPFLLKTIFIDPLQADELLELDQNGQLQHEIINMEIKKKPYSHQARVFEFGIVGFPEIRYIEDNNKIVIKGDKNGVFASGYHIGHKISKIIK